MFSFSQLLFKKILTVVFSIYTSKSKFCTSFYLFSQQVNVLVTILGTVMSIPVIEDEHQEAESLHIITPML